MDKQAGIYRIDVAGTFYYGQSTDLAARRKDHLKRLKGQAHGNSRLQRTYDKYGEFSFKVVLYCETSELDRYEQWYLDRYQPMEKCANVATCAEAPARGRKHTEESKAKMSQAMSKPCSTRRRQAILDARKNPIKVVLNCGKALLFSRSREAADHFGIRETSLNRWLKGTRVPPAKYHISTVARA